MKHTWIIVIGIGVILGGLLYLAGTMSQAPASYTFVEGTNVACLPNGHQTVAAHIHPTLSITVDGESEQIPANIGIDGTCMAETHTHDTSGTIHVETATASRLSELTFADFFAVWGKSIERDGYDLVITVNGSPVPDMSQVPLEDHARIVLAYTSQNN